MCTSVLLLQAIVKDQSTRAAKRPTIEVALFFDAAGYQLFSPYFSGDDTKLRDMLLAYINGVYCVKHRKCIFVIARFLCLYITILSRDMKTDPSF
jgi:hypothetical protein